MVQNISESIKVPASFLLSEMNTIPVEIRTRLLLLAAGKVAPEKVDEERAALIEAMPEKVKTQLVTLDVGLPTDNLELTMKLGDFLFNLFATTVRPVQAPLAIKRHEKRLLDLSEKLAGDEIDVPEDVKKALEPALNEPEKWGKAQFNAAVTIKGETKYLAISAQGASYFNKLLDAAVALYE